MVNSTIDKNKYCPVCGNKIVGRSDKKFCTDKCRTFYHNEKYRQDYIARKKEVIILFILMHI
jgi:Uncharacterized protein containing a Zn-ribbon (DUF2116).